MKEWEGEALFRVDDVPCINFQPDSENSHIIFYLLGGEGNIDFFAYFVPSLLASFFVLPSD